MHRSDQPTLTSGGQPEEAKPAPRGQRHRVAVRFSIHGDLRFISHQDTLRLWARALARAQLPLRYSQGMNPHPKVSLPLPRSVGVASDDDWLLAELSAAVAPVELCRRLADQVPDGLAVLGAEALGPAERWAPTGVVYRLPLPEGGAPDADWEPRIQRCLQDDHLEVRRVTDRGQKVKNLNIRPLIHALRVQDKALEMELNIGPAGAAKPAEVLQVLGLEPSQHLHRLVRRQILWAKTGSSRT